MTTLLSPLPNDDSTRALRKSGDFSNSNGTGRSLADAPPPPPVAANEPPPSRRLLSYELGEKIGAGGMGTVYRAKHAWLDRTVAIKFISPEVLGDPEAIGRFAQEARAIGSLDHPHVVRATDAGCVEGVHYLVTEYIEGCDLQQVVKRRGPLNVANACEAIRQAALGLQHAHERGLVHRDVKPSNLRLDHQGLVKLLDFGVARCNNGQTTMTSTGQMIGTLDYLAPEQASNPRDVDGRADIYSLGCTLYYLLTGEAPFSGPAYDTPASKIKGHLVDAPAPLLGNRCSQLPRAVAAIIERMMAKSPGDRYQTPLDVALALTPYGRNSNLAALVNANYDLGGFSTASAAQNSFWGGLAKGCWHLVWAIPLCLLWLFSRLFRKRPQSGFHPVRSSFMSLSGVVGIGVLIYMLSHVVRIDRFSGHSPLPKAIIISNDAPPVELTPVTVAPAPSNVSKSREPLGITNKFVAPAGAREATGKQRAK